jgi:hemolysin III
VTHALALALSAFGLALLVTRAATYGSGWHVLASAVFAGSLVLLFLASTFYHSATRPVAKRILRRLDHIAVFLVIAGTYTLISLTLLREETVAWVLLGVEWGLALFGIVFKARFGARYELLSTALYLIMGWLVLVVVRSVYAALPGGGFALLVSGGLFYTVGVYFYVKDQSIKYAHSVWHLFVMAGAASHFLVAWYYAIPAPS